MMPATIDDPKALDIVRHAKDAWLAIQPNQ